MPARCAFGCNSTGLVLHRFPNRERFPERFKEWVTLCGGKLETAADYDVYNNKRVCDRHFVQKDHNRNNRLNALAVPSLYLSGVPDSSERDSSTSISPVSFRVSQPKMYIKTTAEIRSEAKRIVWIDLEMTGLEIDKDHILEIACLVTEANLDIVATGPNIIIHQSDEILNNMNQWCITQHGESGLTDACRESEVSVSDAENQILNFVKMHAPENKCALGGNSVYMDRLFLRKYMPKLDSYLHYRIIDVSTIKELAKRWYPKEYSRTPQKTFQHRCLSDIIESIEELKYYKQHVFKNVEN